MAWTNPQKQIAVRACRAAGIGEEHRRLILMNLDNVRLLDSRISSTSKQLTHADCEQFMAIVEHHAGGQILHFTKDYCQRGAADSIGRMRHKVRELAAELEAAGHLAANGVGLCGWISKCMTRGETDRLEELDYQQLRALITGLEAYTRQRAALVPA